MSNWYHSSLEIGTLEADIVFSFAQRIKTSWMMAIECSRHVKVTKLSYLVTRAPKVAY